VVLVLLVLLLLYVACTVHLVYCCGPEW
jgi:hypothetical protein